MSREPSSWSRRLASVFGARRSSTATRRRVRSRFHNRRITLWIGGGVAAVLLTMFLLPIRRPPIDFRWLPNGTSTARQINAAAYRETRWYELGPKDWDPYQVARDLRRRGKSFDDADPRAADLLKQLRDVWDNAPVNPALEGVAVRIPGYVVPLEKDKAGVREFLLVPYFGACIHTPPPPSNQILRVTAAQPLANLRTMDNVWVSGRLHASRSDSSMGMSSYAMTVDFVEPYVRPAQ
jgi:uncharacterized protein